MISLIKNNFKFVLLKALRIAFKFSTVASIYEIAIGKTLDGESTLNSIKWLLIAFVLLYLLSFIGVSLWLFFKKNIKVFSTDKHSVYVHVGDLLDNDIVNNNVEHKNIVINVNRCFDTIVNNELISENTLHGKVLKYLYDEKKYTEKTLQDAIYRRLDGVDYEDVALEEKPQGNLKRYPIGTIAKIDDSTKKSYYLLAMSTFDKNLNAHTSKQEFVLAIQRLIEYCDINSQGFPVLMPLLGSGLSRTGLDNYSDILQYIINSLRMNKDILNCDFHIYIRPQDKQKINFENL